MASETVSSKCATNDDQNSDSLDCADSHDNDSLNRDRAKVTKSWSPIVRKQISSAKCRCSSASRLSHRDLETRDRRSLYRTYSSYGFKNLKKDQSHSDWSLPERSSKNWNDGKCEKGEESCCRKKYELADFQRCLKLLGLNVNNPIELEPQHRKVPNTKKAKPKIVTRLTESTVSLNDIQDAVLNDFERNHAFDPRNRSFLAQAVYERWYFNKLQEQKKQQRENEIKNELMRMEFERIRCEQKLKAERSYKEWIEKKKNHKSLPKAEGTEKTKRNSERKFLPKSPEKEYIKWKTTKNEEIEKKRQQWKEQKQREAEEKQRRKTEADKAYQAWQNKVTEELKKKMVEEKNKLKEKKQDEHKSKEEKEKEAVISFNAWKQNKLQQLKNIQDRQKLESKLKVETRTQRIAERLYEAEQAFYEWLNSVDKRINAAK